jgi:hypothetical protein
LADPIATASPDQAPPAAAPPDHRSTMRALTFNMAAIVAGKVIAVVIGLVSIALITRALGPDGYGAYRTILTSPRS